MTDCLSSFLSFIFIVCIKYYIENLCTGISKEKKFKRKEKKIHAQKLEGIQQAYKLKKNWGKLGGKESLFWAKNRKAERIFHVDYSGILSVLNFFTATPGAINEDGKSLELLALDSHGDKNDWMG